MTLVYQSEVKFFHAQSWYRKAFELIYQNKRRHSLQESNVNSCRSEKVKIYACSMSYSSIYPTVNGQTVPLLLGTAAV